jgi:ribonuclease III family protein
MSGDLRKRRIRTLAWLGDAVFEQRVRWRIAARGDYSTDRLDAMKSDLVRATAQAQLLAATEPELDEDEQAVVRRARNASMPSSARSRRNVAEYRSATALEALVAHWVLAGPPGEARFEALLGPRLEAAIDRAVALHARRLRRG